MSNENEPFEGLHTIREKIVSGIGTPLGFVVLALLIVELFLFGAGGLFDLPIDARITALWVGVGLFVLVFFTVVLLVIFCPKNLVFSEKSHLHAMTIYGVKGRPLSSLSAADIQLVSAPTDNIEVAQISSLTGDEIEVRHEQ